MTCYFNRNGLCGLFNYGLECPYTGDRSADCDFGITPEEVDTNVRRFVIDRAVKNSLNKTEEEDE